MKKSILFVFVLGSIVSLYGMEKPLERGMRDGCGKKCEICSKKTVDAGPRVEWLSSHGMYAHQPCVKYIGLAEKDAFELVKENILLFKKYSSDSLPVELTAFDEEAAHSALIARVNEALKNEKVVRSVLLARVNEALKNKDEEATRSALLARVNESLEGVSCEDYIKYHGADALKKVFDTQAFVAVDDFMHMVYGDRTKERQDCRKECPVCRHKISAKEPYQVWFTDHGFRVHPACFSFTSPKIKAACEKIEQALETIAPLTQEHKSDVLFWLWQHLQPDMRGRSIPDYESEFGADKFEECLDYRVGTVTREYGAVLRARTLPTKMQKVIA